MAAAQVGGVWGSLDCRACFTASLSVPDHIIIRQDIYLPFELRCLFLCVCRSGAKVTLFEAEPSCGGHTLTDSTGQWPVDLGFQVRNMQLVVSPLLIGTSKEQQWQAAVTTACASCHPPASCSCCWLVKQIVTFVNSLQQEISLVGFGKPRCQGSRLAQASCSTSQQQMPVSLHHLSRAASGTRGAPRHCNFTAAVDISTLCL